MTYLGLFFSRYVNGVARRHGEIAQAMHPGFDVKSITNGVHAATWAAPAFAALFDREIPGWRIDNHYLRQANMLHLEHVMEAHAAAKRDLVDEVFARTGVNLDPAVMTIGFARRAATYKRADLVFTDLERCARSRARPGRCSSSSPARPTRRTSRRRSSSAASTARATTCAARSPSSTSRTTT